MMLSFLERKMFIDMRIEEAQREEEAVKSTKK